MNEYKNLTKILWKHVNTYSNYLIKFMSACTQLILNGINLRDVLGYHTKQQVFYF